MNCTGIRFCRRIRSRRGPAVSSTSISPSKVQWNSQEDIAENHIPVDASWTIRYQYDQQLLEIPFGEFETPSSRGNLTGHYGATETELDLKVETGALESYRDFINAIQSAKPGSPDEVKVITGAASWDGKIEADASGTGFNGHIRAERARYENVTVDLLDGDIVYSPDELTLTRGHLRRGAIDTFHRWKSQTDRLEFSAGQCVVGRRELRCDAGGCAAGTRSTVHYPVHGKLTGQFHGRGTRREPNINGLFDLADGEVYGVLFNRLRGQITATRDEVRIADAELRLFRARKEATRGAGIVTGTAEYRMRDSKYFGRSRWRVDSAFEFFQFADGTVPGGWPGLVPRKSDGPGDRAGSGRNVPRRRFARRASGDRQFRGRAEFGWQTRET